MLCTTFVAQNDQTWTTLILCNERGRLTEFSISNLVLEIDGVRVTPPIECGLLPGVMRREARGIGRGRRACAHP